MRRQDAVAEAVGEARPRYKAAVAVLAKRVRSRAEMREYVLRMGLTLTLMRARGLTDQVGQELDAEATAIKKQDPRTVPAIRNVDIAAKRAALLEAQKKGA